MGNKDQDTSKSANGQARKLVGSFIFNPWTQGVCFVLIAAGLVAIAFSLVHKFGTKEGLVLINGTAATVGIIIGGIWVYRAFVRTRQRYPRANTTHHITHWKLPDGRFWIRVCVEVNNVGYILLRLHTVDCRIYKLEPLTDDLVAQVLKCDKQRKIEVDKWEVMDKRFAEYTRNQFVLEPGETDEVIFDLLGNQDTKTICVYTGLDNIARKGRRPVGWSRRSIYNISPEGGR